MIAEPINLQLSLPVSGRGRTLVPVQASLAAECPARQKELGAFYTPPSMAARLAEWAIRSPTDRVLDPSFGGLAFLKASADRLRDLGGDRREVGRQLYGVDLDPAALESARHSAELAFAEEGLILADFFAVDPSRIPPVEALVGNPPYIRYQGFNGSAEHSRELAAAAGVRLTRLASSWAAFVVHGASFIAPGGRMAQVLPAEILHAQYAGEVVEFLRRSFGHVALATFDDRVFPGALEEVVLLFADDYGSRNGSGVQMISCPNITDLDLRSIGVEVPISEGTSGGQAKLLAQLLPPEPRDLLRRCSTAEGASRLGSVASVDIGIVTGANDFFAVTREVAERFPSDLFRRGVSKAAHVVGARLTAKEHETSLAGGQVGLLLVADRSMAASTAVALAKYVEEGEARGLHERYKCRIREPWWSLPIPRAGVPDLLLTYCSNDHPRLALNEADVLQTNTIHGVNVVDGVDAPGLAAGFYNSLTLLSAELVGRSYGGGVLKLEPSEAEELLLPPLPAAVSECLPVVDGAIRSRDLDTALDIVDAVVLVEGLGLAWEDVKHLRVGRERLRDRRKRRGKPAR